MTRKDYQLIATGILMVPGVDIETLNKVAQYIADELERDNPRFDREKFLKACGVI